MPETPQTDETAPATPPLSLEVVPDVDDESALADLRRALATHPRIRAEYASSDLWMTGFDLVGKEGGDHPQFRATLDDLAGGRVVEATGSLGRPDTYEVWPTSGERRPSAEEFSYALGVLRQDPEVARRLDAGELVPYWPVPPLASTSLPSGIVERAVTIGLYDAEGSPRHRVVAVRTDDGGVLHDLPVLPAASDADGGSDFAPDCDPLVGPPRARVRVLRGDDVLWDLTVVRPSASSGTNGSGVELREVDYLRQRVLHRAHLPILNVAFDPGPGRCGPSSRDWLNEEACFEAEGEEAAPGWRVCTSAPVTILDSGADGGGFRGVALWLDGDDLVIVSQLRAGWYRYVCEWRLGADGAIRPRFGASAVHNPCTAEPHVHHAYWRLDFDVTSADNNLVQEFNDPPVGGTLTPWQTVRYEVRRTRDPAHQRIWRVRHARSSLGYTIHPGPHDGTADAYGVGDVWVVAFHPHEVDDDQSFTTDAAVSRTGLDRFVSGEELARADVVVWYGVHLAHRPGGEAVEGRVGPELTPFNWRPPLDREPFAPLRPPSADETVVPGQEDDD